MVGNIWNVTQRYTIHCHSTFLTVRFLCVFVLYIFSLLYIYVSYVGGEVFLGSYNRFSSLQLVINSIKNTLPVTIIYHKDDAVSLTKYTYLYAAVNKHPSYTVHVMRVYESILLSMNCWYAYTRIEAFSYAFAFALALLLFHIYINSTKHIHLDACNSLD